MSSPKTIQLLTPNLSQDNLIKKVQFKRAYRQGGPRIQTEYLQGKTIFHNYGHGAAAWSHGYGSAHLISKMSTKESGGSRTDEYAVLGSGFIGLLTAIQLAKRQYTITLYSERIPQINSETNNLIASQVDPGKWFPSLTDQGSNPLRHQVLSKLSYEYYRDCVDIKRYRSISSAQCYDNQYNEDILRQIAPQFIVGQYRPIQLIVNNKAQSYLQFNSLSLNAPMFIQQLIIEAKLRGIKFVQRKFNSVEQILALKEKNIVNCLGLSAAKLFNDKKVTPIYGNLLIFKNPSNINYLLSTKYEGQQISLYGIKDRLIVGNYSTTSQNKEKQLQNLHTKARLYFGPAPKL